nr:MAG TPA: Restriction endonuclease [Caudoviricetes sp.]
MAGAGISGARLQELVSLLAAGHEYKFYSWPEWRALRLEVLRLDRYECQHCKATGRYRKGYIVHHVKHLRQRPDLALSVFDPDTGQRQLETLCKQCHELEHPESQRQFQPKALPITAERWD